VLFGRWLLPDRAGQSIPVDLSRHAQTLVEHYQLETRLHRLRVGPDSKLVGQSPDSVAADSYDGLSLVAVTDGQSGATRAGALRAGDVLLVRGDPGAAARMAADLRLEAGEHDEPVELESALLNRDTGLAEVIVPARSKLIGQTVFPGMVTEGAGLMILAIQRGAEDTRQAPTAIQAGDHLLLQGPWEALDRHLAGPQTLAVDAPDVVQRQAVALGRSAPQAIGILVLLVVLLAFNIVPPVIAALICASLMVVARVLTLPQVYRGIDWNTVILIAAMIPPATAMAKTGAAHLIGDHIIGLLGAFGPDAVLIGVFLVAAAVSQFISNTSAALVMMPIGLATAAELQVSALPLLMAVAMGASASFLTPFANGVSIMVYGPGGYRFGDFWKLGSLVMLWALLVTAVVVPWHWPFR
jgi:di/tricarboxylate transporter